MYSLVVRVCILCIVLARRASSCTLHISCVVGSKIARLLASTSPSALSCPPSSAITSPHRFSSLGPTL